MFEYFVLWFFISWELESCFPLLLLVANVQEKKDDSTVKDAVEIGAYMVS